MKGRTVIMEDLYIAEEDRNDLERERYALAIERIREIPQEAVCDAALLRCGSISIVWRRLFCIWMKCGRWWRAGNCGR